ncbi:MAG TPA: type II toxin-antitoxin system PemK/MazF family toxin [Sporichthyaceae bacterium]|nr:type II toxin-antitoxin system PemK/MazF family toxin [Sporichthyaceae bacterium]
MSRFVEPWQVWWTDFDPRVGQEQAGERPAVVVGTRLAGELPNDLAIVVPVTSTDRGLPIHPPVDLDGRTSFVMCDQVKSISSRRLRRPHKTTLSLAEIDRIRFVLRRLIDL